MVRSKSSSFAVTKVKWLCTFCVEIMRPCYFFIFLFFLNKILILKIYFDLLYLFEETHFQKTIVPSE